MEDLDMQGRTDMADRAARPGPARQAAGAASGAAGGAASGAAGGVAQTAREQARTVASEVSDQARGVAYDVRHRVTEQARNQNDRLVDGLRRMADELDDMGKDRVDSPVRGVVGQVAQGSRRMADYLSTHGPDGVLREVQDFARRRPGAFLATAVAAGFVVGRLGKSVLGGGDGAAAGRPDMTLGREPYPAAGTGARSGYAGATVVPETGPGTTDAYPQPPAESTTYRSASATGEGLRPAAAPVRPTDETLGRHDPMEWAEGIPR